MIKKFSVVLIILILLLPLTACGGSSGSSNDNSSSGNTSNNNISSDATFATSLQNILDSKAELYNKLQTNMPEEMAFASMDMLTVSLMDLNLAFVSPCGTDGAKEGLEIAFSMFGLTDVNYTENGTNYQISAKTSEGVDVKYDVQYDKATDSMTVKFTEESEEVDFDAVRVDGGYGFMYLASTNDGSGSYDIVKGIVYDDGDGIFATGSIAAKAESVYKNSSIFTNEFVKDGMNNYYEAQDGTCNAKYDGESYEYEAGTGETESE